MDQDTPARLEMTLERLTLEVDRLRTFAAEAENPDIAAEIAEIADRLAETISDTRSAASRRFGDDAGLTKRPCSR